LDDATPLDPVERTRADNTRFRYRAAIGELMWPMITTRPEISYPVVKLSQFSSNPAKVHYDAVSGIFQYLFGTRNDDITYTRTVPTYWGPVITHVPLRSHPMDRKEEHIPLRISQPCMDTVTVIGRWTLDTAAPSLAWFSSLEVQ
jgi:hypothetical protein